MMARKDRFRLIHVDGSKGPVVLIPAAEEVGGVSAQFDMARRYFRRAFPWYFTTGGGGRGPKVRYDGMHRRRAA